MSAVNQITEAWAYGHPGHDFAPGKKAIHHLLHEQQDGKCEYCGHTVEHLHADHVIAKVAGGSDGLENLVGACRRCNSAKRDRSADWMHENIRARRVAYEMMFAVGDVL